MARISISDKLSLVSFDRELVSEIVSKLAIEDLYSLLETLEDVSLDLKTTAKVEKAKDMLLSATMSLIKSKDSESLTKNRNKVTYYINRIKSLTNINTLEFNERLFLYRDDLKELVRIFKRKNNISELLNVNLEELSKEDKKKLTYTISKERKFNKRIRDKFSKERLTSKENAFSKSSENKEVVAIGNLEFEEIVTTENNNNVVDSGSLEFEEITITKKENNNVTDSGNLEFEEISASKEEKPELVAVGQLEFDNLEVGKEQPKNIKVNSGMIDFDKIEVISSLVKEDFKVSGEFSYDEDVTVDTSKISNLRVNDSIGELIENYKLLKTNKYTNNIFTNIKNLFINIPIYFKNKKIIKKMERDYSNYYHGKDLYKLIRYSKYDNSFRCAFGEIIKSKSEKIKNAIKYRERLETIYSGMTISTAKPEDVKFMSLKKASI